MTHPMIDLSQTPNAIGLNIGLPLPDARTLHVVQLDTDRPLATAWIDSNDFEVMAGATARVSHWRDDAQL